MSPSKIFYRIKSDKFHLVKSYFIDMTVMSLLILALVKFDWQINFPFTLFNISGIVLLGVINGLLISSLLHNTSHSNIPTKFLNRMVGEYCGYWVLYGFTNFSLVHILHHQHTDEEMDPVNPKGMSFFVFLSAPMRYMVKATKAYLFSVHGKEAGYQLIMQTQVVVFHLNLILRAAIWYLLLGKILFLTFYLPAFVTIVCIFAHINYVCHRDKVDGSVEIVNLDHNMYYKLANFFTMGGYYHKNHHINMKLFNPKYLNNKRANRPYVSVLPKIYLAPNEQYYMTGSVFSKYFNLNDVWVHGEKNRILTTRKFNGHSTNWF